MEDEHSGTKKMGVTMATLMRKKNMIGSVRNANLNYPKDQKFFHNNDIPEQARNAVAHIKSEIDRDVFKMKRPKWNASVNKAGLPMDDDDPANLFSIKKGFNDYKPNLGIVFS